MRLQALLLLSVCVCVCVCVAAGSVKVQAHTHYYLLNSMPKIKLINQFEKHNSKVLGFHLNVCCYMVIKGSVTDICPSRSWTVLVLATLQV